MIIGVCGLIGSGKDTIADYLVNVHEYRRESFANSLKDAVAHVFGWDRTMLEGRTREAREWREQVDPWWSDRLDMPDLTPRLMLQLWGTEVCRKHFHDDIWIASLENKLRNSRDDVVISDCRFPNEIKAIKQAGGVVVRVMRGDEPDWMVHAKNYMSGPQTIGWAIGRQVLETANVHASEYSWADTEFDQILDNNGTMDQLYQQVNDLVVYLQDATADQAWLSQQHNSNKWF
jgi:hypothetical protein